MRQVHVLIYTDFAQSDAFLAVAVTRSFNVAIDLGQLLPSAEDGGLVVVYALRHVAPSHGVPGVPNFSIKKLGFHQTPVLNRDCRAERTATSPGSCWQFAWPIDNEAQAFEAKIRNPLTHVSTFGTIRESLVMPASQSPGKRGLHDAIEASDEDPADLARILRKTARMTCALGIIFVLCFLAGIYCFARSPRLDASDAELIQYYTSSGADLTILGGLYLLPFAAVAFLWFIAALREWVEHSTRTFDHLLSTVQMLSGVSFITLVFVAAGAVTIVTLSERFSEVLIDETLVREFPLLGRTLLIVFGMRMAAIFVTCTARIGGGASLYPNWFVYGSYLVAATLFLTATLNVWLVVVFPVWVAVLCGIIWQHTLRKPKPAAT